MCVCVCVNQDMTLCNENMTFITNDVSYW